MKSDTKEVGKNTLIYGLGNALNKLLGFILIPIYTSYIPIKDFGVLAILEVSIVALIQILNFGIVAGHQRYFFIRKEENNYGEFLFTINLALLSLIFLFTVPTLFYSKEISFFLFDTSNYSQSVFVTILIIIFEILIIIPFQILQFENKPILYVAFGFLKLLISLLFTLLFILKYNMGIYGIMLGRIIGVSSIYFIQLTLIILKRISFSFKFKYLEEVFKYGFPIVFYAISYLIFTFSDRYMLNWLSGKTDVGLYSFGYKMANFINLIFIQSFGLSYLPSVFKKEKEYDNKAFYSKMLLFYTVAVSFIILFFVATYEFALIPFVKNKSYLVGLSIVPVISISFLIHGMNNFASIGLYLKNKTKLLVFTSTATAIMNIILNYWMIPKYGFMGAAYATLISQFFNTFIMTILSQKLFFINYNWKKITLIMFSLILSLYTINLFDSSSLNILFNITVVIIFSLIIFLFVLKKEEKEAIFYLIRKIRIKDKKQ